MPKALSLFLALALLACASIANAAQDYRPEVAAHRGASGYLPEHTLPAKAMAYAMGVNFPDKVVNYLKANNMR